MEEHTMPAEAEIVRDLAFKAMDVEGRRIEGPDGAQYVLLTGDGGQERLTLLAEAGGVATAKPGRIAQKITIHDEASLVDYAARFRDANSLVLGDLRGDRAVVILDYHSSSRDNYADVDPDLRPVSFQAEHLGHVATLALQKSLEWAEWTAIDGKLLPQLDFVRFLEENREDVVSPDAATILEAARDLQALRKADFRSLVRTNTDHVTIEYAEEAEARSKNDITLPSEFTLSLPVYFEGPLVEVVAILRWKIAEGGGLQLGVKLKRAERVRQEEFRRVITELSKATKIPAVYGSIGS